jgi:3alpha(or 20beta)-hydroxysteroid dehydrogenase
MASERLAGKVALVTGGARGMGAAHARAITAEGGRVMLADVRDADGAKLAADLGDAAAYVHLDVTDVEQWRTAVERTVDTFGALNVLVNNAGITTFGTVDGYSRADWDRTIDIDLTGAFLGMSVAMAQLRRSAPSSVINISSTAGLQGSARLHAYTAAKWGLRGLTKSVALEVGRDGVRVNSVHPGVVHTPMIDGFDVSSLGEGALGRGAQPEEIAHLVVYLASDESSFSTGAEFVVDGGMTAGTPAFGPAE